MVAGHACRHLMVKQYTAAAAFCHAHRLPHMRDLQGPVRRKSLRMSACSPFGVGDTTGLDTSCPQTAWGIGACAMGSLGAI